MPQRFGRGLRRRTGIASSPGAPPMFQGSRIAEPSDPSIRGQGLVEFALVLPMFLLLLIGVTEFGRAWMTRNVLTGASREAVRIAAVQGNAATALSRANSILASAGISGATVDIQDDGAPYGTCIVSVSYDFPVAVAGFLNKYGVLSGNSVALTTSTSMRKEF